MKNLNIGDTVTIRGYNNIFKILSFVKIDGSDVRYWRCKELNGDITEVAKEEDIDKFISF